MEAVFDIGYNHVFLGYIFLEKRFLPLFSAETSNIVSGLGFNGYDEKGRPLWNKLPCVNALSVEVNKEKHGSMASLSCCDCGCGCES